MIRNFLITICVLFFSGIFFVNDANAITIIPPRVDLAADPGSAVEGVVRIYNETETTLTLYASTANFTAKQGKEGVPEFLAPEESSYGLASWIEVEKGPINVLPKEYKTINYSIIVPFDADPGGHYAGIFFGSGNPAEKESKTAVGLSSKAGTLVLLGVSGKVLEIGKLEEFILKEQKSFFERLPVDFTIGFANSGNVHLRPEGEIAIKNIFGKQVAAIGVNKRKIGTGINILPNTARHMEASWKNSEGDIPGSGQDFWSKVRAEKENFAAGRYTADLNLIYGSNKKAVGGSVVFWVFPWHLFLIYALAGIIVFLALRFLIKKYNRWIISQATKK